MAKPAVGSAVEAYFVKLLAMLHRHGTGNAICDLEILLPALLRNVLVLRDRQRHEIENARTSTNESPCAPKKSAAYPAIASIQHSAARPIPVSAPVIKTTGELMISLP